MPGSPKPPTAPSEGTPATPPVVSGPRIVQPAIGSVEIVQPDGTTQTTGYQLIAGQGINLTPQGNGTVVSASAMSTSPGGANTDVQFNDHGAFGGDPGLTYDKTVGGLAISASGYFALANTGTLPAVGVIREVYNGGAVVPILEVKDSGGTDRSLIAYGAGDAWSLGNSAQGLTINGFGGALVSMLSSSDLILQATPASIVSVSTRSGERHLMAEHNAPYGLGRGVDFSVVALTSGGTYSLPAPLFMLMGDTFEIDNASGGSITVSGNGTTIYGVGVSETLQDGEGRLYRFDDGSVSGSTKWIHAASSPPIVSPAASGFALTWSYVDWWTAKQVIDSASYTWTVGSNFTAGVSFIAITGSCVLSGVRFIYLPSDHGARTVKFGLVDMTTNTRIDNVSAALVDGQTGILNFPSSHTLVKGHRYAIVAYATAGGVAYPVQVLVTNIGPPWTQTQGGQDQNVLWRIDGGIYIQQPGIVFGAGDTSTLTPTDSTENNLCAVEPVFSA